MVAYLLTRPEDHVLLGVEPVGFVADGGRWRAAAGGGRLVVTFPPQHVLEETSPAGSPAPLVSQSVPVWRAALSGPSRLVVTLPEGSVVVPTAEGLLRALADGTVDAGTAIELPGRLTLRPAGTGVRSAHPALPVTAAGTSGLWRARLGRPDLVAVDAGAADPAGFAIPLNRGERLQLVGATAQRPATATRLELSALGGTLEAAGDWTGFVWRQLTVLGRDVRVRTQTTGILYPLGHRALYQDFTERIFDPDAGGAAVLRVLRVLTVTEPVKRAPERPGPLTRAFPFGDVEITRLVFTDLGRPEFPSDAAHFWPRTAGDRRLAFPVRCQNGLTFELPLLFVPDLTAGGSGTPLADYGQQQIDLPATPVDLVRSADPQPADVQELHGITIAGTPLGEARPRLAAMRVGLPAMRSLLGADVVKEATFADEYVTGGETGRALLRLAGDRVPVDFVGRSGLSGGLVAPSFATDAISRTLGPVDLSAVNPLTGKFDPRRLFPGGASLLGFALRDLLGALDVPPAITSALETGRPPQVTMAWTGVPLKAFQAFRPDPGAGTLDLSVTVSESGSVTHCSVRAFTLLLPDPATALLELHFDELVFDHRSGGPPRLDVRGVGARFRGELALLEELQRSVDLGGLSPFVDVTPTGVRAHYSRPLPPVRAGAFVLSGIALAAGVDVPFDGRPVTVSLGFASRANPFTLAILMFGGGGYLELEIDHDGLVRLEGALEFGALVAVDFFVAHGEVHVLGGIRFELGPAGVALTGYLRLGGCVEIFGLISVSIELCVSLAYRSDSKELVGRATLVIEVDLTLWSESVALDSGEWVLAGGSAPRTLFAATDDGLERWHKYRDAFAEVR
jgi:hypothetical protein